MGKKLNTQNMMIEVEVRDKDGKILSKTTEKAHSWLKQWIQIIKAEFATRSQVTTGDGNETITYESGASNTYPRNTSSTIACYSMNLSTLGDSADVTHGIIVGTSDLANGLTTYMLGAKVGHGNGGGQLMYGTETVEAITNPSGLTYQFRILRPFTNSSGVSITVKEIGLLVKKADNAGTLRSYLIARDVLTSPQAVPDAATLTVRYTVPITIA
jgi:hypothetical protein